MNTHLTASVPPLPPRPPEYPPIPGRPEPSQPGQPPQRSRFTNDEVWSTRLSERLLERRIVLAHGDLDEVAATRLCAQLLTLDAESTQPIRLEVQGLGADLSAALTVMDVLDVMRGPVSAYASGRITGPALGVVAAADHRYAYPSALFVLCEPRMRFEGTIATLEAHEAQLRNMRDRLLSKLADATGRPVHQLHADFQNQRLLTVDEALDYGLIEGGAQPRRPARTGLQPPEKN